MDNKQILRFFEANFLDTHIDKLFWIAASFESSELWDTINEIDAEVLKNIIPGISTDPETLSYYFQDKYGRRELFVDYNAFGLIAEVHIPTLSDFKFKDGETEPWTFDFSAGRCYVTYVYAEDQQQLFEKIREAVKKSHADDLKRFKEKNQKEVEK